MPGFNAYDLKAGEGPATGVQDQTKTHIFIAVCPKDFSPAYIVSATFFFCNMDLGTCRLWITNRAYGEFSSGFVTEKNRSGGFEFSQGRDLVVEPGPANGPINFLAYPVLEVDGKPVKAGRRFFFTRKQGPAG